MHYQLQHTLLTRDCWWIQLYIHRFQCFFLKSLHRITAVPASFHFILDPFLESFLSLISHSYKLKCLQISVFSDCQHAPTILPFISPSKDLRLPMETDPQIWHGLLSPFTSRLRNAQSWPKRRMSTTRSQEPRMYL